MKSTGRTIDVQKGNPSSIAICRSALSSNVTVPAGKYLGFYSITNGTTATFRAANPTNASGGAVNALFSFDDANPDGQTHFRWFSAGQQQTSPDAQQLHIMNQLNGKEDDFDSFRLNLSFDT